MLLDKNTGNLSQKALLSIKEAITYGRLNFGEPISEVAVSEAMEISKAPVRSALIQLRELGLVEIVPQSGCYVINPSEIDVTQLLEFRTILEIQAMNISVTLHKDDLIDELDILSNQMHESFQEHDWARCQVLDTAFHDSFFKHAHNKYLKKSYDNIEPLVTALLFRFIRTHAEKNEAYEDHYAILDLLKANKISDVEKYLTKHIQRTIHTYRQQDWPTGRSSRKEYSFRNYKDVFMK